MVKAEESWVSPLLPERFVYRELWLLNCTLLEEKLVRGPGEKLLFTPPVEKCNLERSLEAVRAATSPTISDTHLAGRMGPTGRALHSRTDVIKKDTSKQSSPVTFCIKASEILLTEKELHFQVPYVEVSKMAKKYFTDV